jgi:hypothetical protein
VLIGLSVGALCMSVLLGVAEYISYNAGPRLPLPTVAVDEQGKTSEVTVIPYTPSTTELIFSQPTNWLALALFVVGVALMPRGARANPETEQALPADSGTR